jgi:predicted nucleic acid-binding Zn ribbon protein
MPRCLRCGRPLAKRVRSDMRFCSARCRVAVWRKRKRMASAVARHCAVCRTRLPLERRLDARFCSAACRKRSFRRRKAAAVAAMPRKAHQRIIRERLAANGVERTADIRTALVQAISTAEAKAVIEQFEWLGTMPAAVRHCFGIFFAGELGGAVVYASEPSESLHVWDRYKFTGKIIALARGACLHWAHPHAASKLIRRSMALLPQRYKVITASVDQLAGEVGTIYQACGFDYVGTMRSGGRALVTINGKNISERQAYRIAGTRGARALAQLGFDVRSVRRRGRYFAFRGSRAERRKHREAIIHLIKPYAKRDAPAKG